MASRDQVSEFLAAHEVLTSTPEVWLEVSRGTVSAEQAARTVEGEEDPALIERSRVLFAPPTALQERRIRTRALEAGAASASPAGWIGGLLAVAAALLLALALRPGEVAEYAPLGVGYQVEMSAGWEATRGQPGRPHDPIPRYRLDQQVDFTLRPEATLDATRLDVLAVAHDTQGRQVVVSPRHRVTTTKGVVHLSATLDDAGLAPGTWTLTFVVGRAGQVPDSPQRFAPGAPPTPASLAVVRQKIRVDDIDG